MWPPSIDFEGSYALKAPVYAPNDCNYVHLNCRYHHLAYAELGVHQVTAAGT